MRLTQKSNIAWWNREQLQKPDALTLDANGNFEGVLGERNRDISEPLRMTRLYKTLRQKKQNCIIFTASAYWGLQASSFFLPNIGSIMGYAGADTLITQCWSRFSSQNQGLTSDSSTFRCKTSPDHHSSTTMLYRSLCLHVLKHGQPFLLWLHRSKGRCICCLMFH